MKTIPKIFAVCSSVFIFSCVAATSNSSMPVSGSAAGSTAEGVNPQLERCNKPLGTVAIYEDINAPWYVYLKRDFKVDRLAPLMRLMIQQSNCFVVVERGEAFRTGMTMERELQKSGELRANSNFGKGQMVAADFTLTPSINYSETTGGGYGGIGSLLPGGIGAIVGQLKTKESSVTLLLTENRSGVQVVAAEGSAKGYNVFGIGGVFAGGLGAVGGGFGNTPEQKILMTAFLDAYNKLVKAAREYKMQTVEGGLGTGGSLKVQGAEEVKQNSTNTQLKKKLK